jgi:hypothetical protein
MSLVISAGGSGIHRPIKRASKKCQESLVTPGTEYQARKWCEEERQTWSICISSPLAQSAEQTVSFTKVLGFLVWKESPVYVWSICLLQVLFWYETDLFSEQSCSLRLQTKGHILFTKNCDQILECIDYLLDDWWHCTVYSL